MRKHLKKYPRKNRGYVLVLTLAVISLAAISLTGLARHSLNLSLEAIDAEQELQRRWALISCEQQLLGRADELLITLVPINVANTPPWPKPRQLVARFELGPSRYWVRIADENAKINLNLIHAKKPEQVLLMVNGLADQSSAAFLPMRLRPWPASLDAPPAFESWGQVFDFGQIGEEVDVAGQLADLTAEATCWGNEKINFRRCTDQAIEQVCGLVLKKRDVVELIELRKTWTGEELNDLLRQLGLRRSKLSKLRRHLTDESTCQSLWVRSEDAPGNHLSTLFVTGAGGPSGGQTIRFTW